MTTNSSWNPILVEYDADSKQPVSGHNRYVWPSILKSAGFNSKPRVIPREWGAVVESTLELNVVGVIEEGGRPLILGGSHGLTYYCVQELVRFYGPINILHFDAHHDRYAYALPTHFSVFERMQRHLPIAIQPVGHRFENDLAMPLLRPVQKNAPWYVSVDFDYFDPAIITHVMHAVPPSAEGLSGTLAAFTHALATISGERVVGGDCVEWIAPLEDSSEWSVAAQVVGQILELGA